MGRAGQSDDASRDASGDGSDGCDGSDSVAVTHDKPSEQVAAPSAVRRWVSGEHDTFDYSRHGVQPTATIQLRRAAVTSSSGRGSSSTTTVAALSFFQRRTDGVFMHTRSEATTIEARAGDGSRDHDSGSLDSPTRVGSTEQLCSFIKANDFGQDTVLQGPFGPTPVVYADSTASGRSLHCIEQYIQEQVLPTYSNTHSSASRCGLETTFFVREARDLIRDAVNASSEKDVVLFAGTGCTGAVAKAAAILGLERKPAPPTNVRLACQFPGCTSTFIDEGSFKLHAREHTDGQQASCAPVAVPDTESPPGDQAPPSTVVFIGPMEHHSNILTWRESNAKVVEIKPDDDLTLSLADLRSQLIAHKDFKLKIGSFSAGSNVTGILEKVDAVTEVLHKHGALAFWDYAAVGPHMAVDMNPTPANHVDHFLLEKDAVFLSPHKFAGGPGTPGVLVIKKRLVHDAVPSIPGGGTVFYVTKDTHRYLENIEEREEGGTPDIVGMIRAGLVFQLKSAVSDTAIVARERAHMKAVLSTWERNPAMCILGCSDAETPRIPIISFMVRYPGTGRFLHWNYVTVLLNDLFGIQCRGGCACAGPYGHRLLGICDEAALLFERELLDKHEMLRPGFVRVSLGYYEDDEFVAFVRDAVDFVASHGWKLLPAYTFDPEMGEWKHKAWRGRAPFRRWLHNVSYAHGSMSWPHGMGGVGRGDEDDGATGGAGDAENDRRCSRALAPAKLLERAHAAVKEVVEQHATKRSSRNVLDQSAILSPVAHERHLRWFAMPSEAAARLVSSGTSDSSEQPAVVAASQEEPPAGTINLVPEFVSASSTTGDGQLPECITGTCPLISSSSLAASVAAEPAPVVEVPTKRLFPSVPRSLLKPVGQAIADFKLIRPGDRVLLGLSGGKDSMSLLHILIALKKKAPISFDLACVTMDPQFPGFNPAPLIPYLKKLGIPYFFESQALLETAQQCNPSSICGWCSRMKRGILYSCARREGYNVLALAQHLDDLAESFVMSAFHNGKLRTMAAQYTNDAGDVRVIRPLVYCRERLTREFAASAGLPIIPENCPACFEGPRERYRVKTLLAQQEHLYPGLMGNLLRAMRPLMEGEIVSTVKKGAGRPSTAAAATKRREAEQGKTATEEASISGPARSGGKGNQGGQQPPKVGDGGAAAAEAEAAAVAVPNANDKPATALLTTALLCLGSAAVAAAVTARAMRT
eukprot:m.82757 g.82757  ORF g.82757 m.82757 type:complete len:1210 (+) comp14741_c0_seq3:185-3814(+)